MGSDAIYTMFGENTRELGWFVKAGMTPEQALRTATTNAAELLEKKRTRAVAPAYFADLVAVVKATPRGHQRGIKQCALVMKGGAVVRTRPRDKIASEKPNRRRTPPFAKTKPQT